MRTLLDLFKTFMEEPHKLARAVMMTLRCGFTVLFSIVLYKQLYDSVGTAELSDWAFWRDWVVTGKALIWAFFCVLSFRLLFTVLPILTINSLEWYGGKLWRRQVRDKEKFARIILRLMTQTQLLTYDEKADHLKAGRHTRALLELLEDLGKTDPDDEPPLSAYLQGWHLFFLFALFYFCSRLYVGHTVLSMLIVFLFVSVPIVYIQTLRFYNFLLKRLEKFLFVVRGLAFDQELEDELRDRGYPLAEHRSEDGKRYWRTIDYAGQQWFFFVNWTNILDPKQIDKIMGAKALTKEPLFLVANVLPEEGIKETIASRYPNLKIVVIPTSADILGTVTSVFPHMRASQYLF
jgi:hypothetical protein